MANTTTTTQPPAANQQQSYPMASLYVGDLHPDVTEAMIYEKFSQSGPVLSIRVCRDMITRKSLGYAYVNFQQPQDAERALDTMNFDVMKGRAIRIMWSQRDPSLRKSGVGNIFIKNLDKSIEQKEFYDTFTVFGNILSCKIATDETGKSRGYGFVHFETEEAAVGATSKINGMMINGKKVFVGKFIPKVERHDYYGDKAFTNVFVKNFGQELDDEKLNDLFKVYGEITSAKVMTDDNDKSKGFGFVCFKEPEDADLAVNELNGTDFKGRALFCGRAQKKTERHYELRSRFEKQRMERSARYAAGVNLYVKNLDDTLDDDRLKKEFVVFGNITSAKVMTDQTGRSKGFGFVCFSNPEEATKAVTEMNGKIVCTKPLYVALAQRKEDRKQHLASQYMQRMTSRYPNMPMQLPMPMQQTQPPLAYNMMQMPRSQQAYMAAPMQRGPTPRWSGPPQSMPGNRMGTNFSMGPTNQGMQSAPGGPQQQMRPQRPSNPQTMIRAQQRAIIGNQPGQAHMPQTRSLASVVASGVPQTQGKPTATPATQRPVPQSGVARYNTNVRNIAPNAMPAAVPTGMSQAPDEQLRIGNHDPITTSILANANPQEQKQMLGERLYPLVHEMHNELAGKITGMLLEIDNAELLHMLESNESLKAKVDEAVNVLQNHQAKGTVPPSSASVATAGDKQ